MTEQQHQPEVDLNRANHSIKRLMASRIIASLCISAGASFYIAQDIQSGNETKEAIEDISEAVCEYNPESCEEMESVVESIEPVGSSTQYIAGGLTGFGLLLANLGFIAEARDRRRAVSKFSR